MSNVIVYGIKKNCLEKEFFKRVKKILYESTNNLEWLKKGDKILLKPALNSPDPYPSTTDPLLLKSLIKILEKKGAKIILADQSGIGHVWHSKKGVKKGNSKYNYEISGMKQTNNEFIALEQTGWDKGFFNFKSKNVHSWKNGFYITNLIKKVDHIINLPRLSTHAQVGVSLGFKNFVGLLREDSRIEFHGKGPFKVFTNKTGKILGLLKPNTEGDFFKKIVEISLSLKNKLRLTFFSATKAQTTFGPDKQVLPLIGCANKIVPDTGLIFASNNQVSAEIFAIKYLTFLYQNHTPIHKKILQKLLVKFNGQIKELGKQEILQNPFIKYAIEKKLGTNKITIKYYNTPKKIQEKIRII
jgi:uncharacterized protein (DUF362 family)